MMKNLLGLSFGFLLSAFALSALPFAAQGPTVSWATPPEGATVAGTVALGVASSITTACVQYSVDDQVLGTSNIGAFGLNWNSVGVPDGPHTLKAIAEDTTGVDSAPALRSITVSNGVVPPPPPPPVLPTMTVSSITSGNSGNYTLTARLSQPLAGTVTMVVTWPTGTTKTLSATMTAGVATAQLKLKGQPHGLYIVQAVTVVNSTSVSAMITFRY
jgi:hypothetical protein